MYKQRPKVAAMIVLLACWVVAWVLVPEAGKPRAFVGSMGPTKVALAQDRGKLVNVKEFGATGNGLSDDTAAIQAAINAAGAGTTIRFPAGVYVVADLVVENRSGLSFVGGGRNSVIKQKTGSVRMATFTNSRDIVINKLAFDANGITAYGGVVFYQAAGVRIEDNWYIDSAAKPVGNEDRYAFLFARGATPSRDIRIVNNVIEDLQLEVDHSQRVVIDRNTVRRAVKTAGIGIFSISPKAIAEDYQITNNTVIDPVRNGFSVGIDPPTDGDCVFRRIAISGNQVIRTKTAGYGLRIGTGDNSKATRGNIFEDITIKDNRFQVERTAPKPDQIIFTNTTDRAGIVFSRLRITGNTIENRGPHSDVFAIELRQIQNSVLSDNTLKGVSNGISLKGDLLANDIRNNVIEASGIGFKFDDSLGRNRVAQIKIIGNPKEKIVLSNLKESDLIEK
jgi:hypothetical protein